MTFSLDLKKKKENNKNTKKKQNIKERLRKQSAQDSSLKRRLV